jgi:hypothetical protein
MTIQFAQLYTRKIVLGTVVRHRFSQHITMNFKEMYTIRNRVHKQLIKHHSILMHIPIPNISNVCNTMPITSSGFASIADEMVDSCSG